MKPANRGRASMLLSKAIAEAAVAVATQLVGQRLYAAYDAMRRYEAMRRRPSAGPGEDEERLPPTPEQVVERLVEEVIERSKQAFERHRPVLARARARTRVGLQQPAIAAVVVGGSVVGAVSALGVVPFALGAGAAYLVYRRLQPEDGAARPAS